jgi:signal transduction histidine kinase
LIISLPTELNFVSFDLLNCGNNDGSGWYLNYIYQLFILISILLIPVYKINRVSNKDDKYKILFISLSSFVFLFFFFVSNFFGDIFSLYEINLIGPVGMLVMVILLSFSISKYKLFNIKLLIPQILVAVLLFLNFAMLFAKDMWSAKLIIVVTLLVTFIIGYLLIRSVKKVDKQRELLEISNRNQQTLIHFITHQIKGFLTKSKGVFSMLQEGDYGVLPPEAEKIVGEGLKSDNKAVDMVQEILHASNLKNGTMTYNMSSVDISSMIKNIFEGFKDSAIKKGLIFELEANEEVKINGDSTQLENVFKNLIDNSIKYTQAGFVNVSLKKSDNKAIFEIADSGIGISESDRNRLFTEGGRGEESTKVNVESTGYGLFIVKKIIDEHKGKIDVESKGRNKGSKFRVELPLV